MLFYVLKMTYFLSGILVSFWLKNLCPGTHQSGPDADEVKLSHWTQSGSPRYDFTIEITQFQQKIFINLFV